MFVAQKFHKIPKGGRVCPNVFASGHLFCLHTNNDIRRSTPCAYCNGMHKPLGIMDFCNGKWTPFFYRPHAKNNYTFMSNLFEKQANGLIMVTTDQSVFPVEVKKENVAVNLTAMSKSFDKRVRDWLRTSETKEYLKVISKTQKCVLADLVQVKYGGTPGENGTWCYDYRIALRFAQWLSPEFSVMVDEIILKLLSGEYNMTKKDTTKIELAKGVVLNVIPSDKHGFLIPTSEIARAMHISTSTLRANKSNNKLHFQRDIHFIKDYEFLDKATGITSFCTMWTKKGLIEMASHLRGGYSRLLRDWAECQICGVAYNPGLFADQVNMKEIPVNIAHKRLTPTRMVSALALVARIEDSAIRNQLVNVLTGGTNYGTI